MRSGVRTLPVAIAAVLALLGCMLACTSAASAAAKWLGPVDLSSPLAFADGASVAVDPEGEAIAVWRQVNPTTALESSVHPPGQSWQPPVPISSNVSGDGQVAVDARGDATSIWLDNVGTLMGATRAAGAGAWSSAVPISPVVAEAPQLAVNARGDAVAVWTLGIATNTSIVQASFKLAGTSAWQPPVQLSTTPGITPPSNVVTVPQVALDAQGDAVATWVQTVAMSPSIVAASRPAVSGVWQSPVPLSGSSGASTPVVALDGAGRATAMWSDSTGIRAADLPPGGAWSSPATVPGSAGGSAPSLAVDQPGNATAAWNQPVSGGTVADVATRPSGGVWPQTPTTLSAAQSTFEQPSPQVKLDARGGAVAVWDAFDGTNHTVMAAARPPGGSWPAPAAATTVSSFSEDLLGEQLAVDPQGNATVVWSLFDGSTDLVQGAGYDGAGPLLNGLSIPPRAVAGTPVTFSVAPVDAWSPVSSTSWDFGDGQAGSGETLGHVYANPGTYKIRVTSIDGLGNSTTGTGTITISPHGSVISTSAPTLSQVSQSHRKWREGGKPATIARKRKPKPAPVGTTFSFTVSQTAQVTLTFIQSTAGRNVKGRCQTPTKHNRKRPSCKRTVTRGTLTDSVTAGHHTVRFQGRAGKSKLPLGAYTLKLTATNATEQHSRTATLKFTIVK